MMKLGDSVLQVQEELFLTLKVCLDASELGSILFLGQGLTKYLMPSDSKFWASTI